MAGSASVAPLFKAALLSICTFAAIGFDAPAVKSEQTPPLTQIVRKTLEIYFAPGKNRSMAIRRFVNELPVDAQYNKPRGVFVTLSEHGKSRGCWGSIFPEQSNVVKSTVYASIAAATRDYRYKKISNAEILNLEPQVTVIKSVEPIRSFHSLNPYRDGLMVRSGGKSGVLLPREATDAYYQLVQCKVKAGIAPREPCQLYRLNADIYE
jgi:AMMECR1 domain-containing protein